MTIQELVDKDLWDKNTLMVRTRPGENSGNPIRFSAELGLFLTDDMDQEDVFEGLDRLMSDDHGGLYYKAPATYGQHLDQVTQDDLIPLAHYFYRQGSWYRALQILEYIKDHFGFYTTNTEVSLARRFIGRNLSMMAHLHWCARLRPNWVLRKAQKWAIETCDVSNQDSAVLTWHMIKVLDPQDPEYRLAIAQWWTRFYARWPQGMPQVIEAYCQFSHPLATGWET